MRTLYAKFYILMIIVVASIMTWVLGSFIYLGDFVKTDEHLAWSFMLALAVSIVILFVLSFLIARVVRQAEVELKAANENLENKVEEKTQDYQAANEELIAQNEEIMSMNHEINALNQTLKNLTEALEDRVSQRTAELTAAHEELSTQYEYLLQSQETQWRNAEIQIVLREIAEAATISSSLDELYQTAHRLMERVLPAKNFYISLLDEANGQIVRPYCVDEADLVPQRRPLGNGLTEYFMRMGRTLHVTSELFAQLRATGEVDLYFAPVFECIGAPLRDANGKIFGVLTMCLNDKAPPFEPEDSEVLSIIAAQVSMAIERKRTLEELQSSEGRLNRAQSIAHVGDWEIDIRNKQVWASAEAFRIYGITQNTPYLSMSTIQKIVHSSDRVRLNMAMDALLTKNEKYDLEFKINRMDDGRERVMHSVAELQYDPNGKPVKIVGILQDITERVRYEQEIRRDVKLAARVQSALLPVPQVSEYISIDTVCKPFGYVGGDLYFLDWRYGGNLLRGFLVDAPGHGLGTALHTASLHVLLREVNERDLPLSDTMRWLNKRAGEYFDEATFAGAMAFEFDLQTRQLRWACAGIPRFWMAAKAGQGAVDRPGMCLGLREDEIFDMHTMMIDVGNSFYFMTHGIADLLSGEADLPLDRYPEMVELVRVKSESEDCRDDATVICIHVLALPQSIVRQDGWPRIIRFNGYGDYQRLKGEVGKILAEVTGMPHSFHEVAVNEALANAMECRDGVPRQHTARLRFNKVGSRLIVRVKTSRMGFAGNAVLRRLRSQPEDMFSFGEDAAMGRGIPMMLAMSHKMTYNSEGTEVLLAWKL